MPWLNKKLGLFSRRPQDVQATLQQFTAVTLAAAVRRHAPGAALYVCGGGAHNAALVESLAQLVAPNRVATTAALGLDPDYVEAVAFAWFARRRRQRNRRRGRANPGRCVSIRLAPMFHHTVTRRAPDFAA